MTRNAKLIEKARNNPSGLRFQEFETMLKQCGWCLDHQRGSHKIWVSKQGQRLPIQNNSGKAKGYQVKQFIKIYDEEQGNER